jgi:hypothetical protein
VPSVWNQNCRMRGGAAPERTAPSAHRVSSKRLLGRSRLERTQRIAPSNGCEARTPIPRRAARLRWH